MGSYAAAAVSGPKGHMVPMFGVTHFVWKGFNLSFQAKMVATPALKNLAWTLNLLEHAGNDAVSRQRAERLQEQYILDQLRAFERDPEIEARL